MSDHPQEVAVGHMLLIHHGTTAPRGTPVRRA
jgi:hypothetical protein